MLRITKLTDYAIVVLTHLAGGGVDSAHNAHNARDVAERTRIPRPTVSKILKELARGGIVVSQRGVQGGYRLARAPENVSLADIIDAVEGPVALTECSSIEPEACEHAGTCPVEANWLRINQVVRRALAGISLADMAKPLSPPLIHLSRPRDAASRSTGGS